MLISLAKITRYIMRNILLGGNGEMIKNKKSNVVIMDGTNTKVLKSIIGVIEMINGKFRGKIECRDAGDNYPSMKVIEFKTDKERLNEIQEIIEESYPALCLFDVVV